MNLSGGVRAVGEGSEIIREVVEKGREGGDVEGVDDAEVIELRDERRDERFDFVGAAVGERDRLEKENAIDDRVGRHAPLIHPSGKVGVERTDGLPVCSLSQVGGGKRDLSGADDSVGVRFHRHGHNDGVGSRPTSTQSPVEIGIARGSSDKVPTPGRDDFPFQNIVSTQAMDGTENRVASALSITSSNPNSRTCTPNHTELLCLCSFICLPCLHTSSHSDRRAGVLIAGEIQEADGFKVMGPDAQSPFSGGFS